MRGSLAIYCTNYGLRLSCDIAANTLSPESPDSYVLWLWLLLNKSNYNDSEVEYI